MRTRMATLNAQLDATWRASKGAKPKSKRLIRLQSTMVTLQIKRMKQELKGKTK
jgi:hypothetical protein